MKLYKKFKHHERPFILHIAICDNSKELAQRINRSKNKLAPIPLDYFEFNQKDEALTYDICDFLPGNFVIVFNNKPSQAIIIHESFHCVAQHFRYIGQPLDENSEESYAYMLDWLTSIITKAVNYDRPTKKADPGLYDKIKQRQPPESGMPPASVLADYFLKSNPDCGLKSISLVRHFHKAAKGKLVKPSIDEIINQIKTNQQAAQVFNTPAPAPFIAPAPLPKETESNWYQLKQFWDKKLFKVLIFSDCHGWLADLKALRCINQVLKKHHRYDEVCINGDVVDMPYISRHTRKLYEEGILNGYSEVKEIDYTNQQILAPLRLSTDAKIRVRIGNHDERITKPNLLGEGQMARLAVLYKHFMSTKFEEMLSLNQTNGFIYDPSDVFSYFDKFDVVHGLSLAKNASEKNIQEYMSSGTSGHSHRLNSKFLTNRRAPYVWFESGHTRIGEQVEYLPTGKIADWQQGFIDINFLIEGDKVRFFAQTVNIIEGRCMFNGVVYDGN